MRKNMILLFTVVLWCVGCVVEKAVDAKDSGNEALSQTSCNCDARIIRVLGLSNDYFCDTEFFKSGKVSLVSSEVELVEPFGPFNRAKCILSARTPTVVDVTTADRSNATNTLPRYFMYTVSLMREFGPETTAEDLEKEVEMLVTQLNDIFGTQLDSPVLEPIAEIGEKNESVRTGTRNLLFRRSLIDQGRMSALNVSIGLKGQRINIAAHEPVYCKRDGVMKLKSPAKLAMNIAMDRGVGDLSKDSDVEVKPIVLGGDNVKAFVGAFSQGAYHFGRAASRSPAQYEYNLDTKRITKTAVGTNPVQPLLGRGAHRARRLQRQQETQAAAAKQREEQAARKVERRAEAEQERLLQENRLREAERAEQRRELESLRDELKRQREEMLRARCATNESTVAKSDGTNGGASSSSRPTGRSSKEGIR